MVILSGRHFRAAFGPAVLLAIVLGGPAVSHAQLIPNLNVRRERPPCVAEPPFYPLVRQQYFGYYPTCWRKFPPGWACPCPNPELPNWQASLAKDPIRTESGDSPRPGGEEDPFTAPDRGNRDPGDDRNLPPPPDDNASPFEKDAKDAMDARPDNPPGLDEAPAPRRDRPRPNGADLLPRTEVAPAPAPAVIEARAEARARTVAPTEVPPLVLTDEEDAAPLAPPLNGPAGMPVAPASSLPGASTIDATPTPPPLAPTVQAPARRSILGNIFGRTRRR